MRYLPLTSPVWYSQNNDLVGGLTRGTAYDYLLEWSLQFGEFDEFCFSTRNFAHWLMCSQGSAIAMNYDNFLRPVLRSSANNLSHTVIWFNNANVGADPRISVSNHMTDMLYAENMRAFVFQTSNLVSVDGGMNVWVRSGGSANKPAVAPAAGPLS